MKILRNILDKAKKNFEKGSKYEKWMPVFESFETFFYVPETVTNKGSHIRDAVDLKRVMSIVIFALMPALLFGAWNVGYQHDLAIGKNVIDIWAQFSFGFMEILPIIITSYAAGLGLEFVFVYLRGHEINEGFLVSGMLIPLIMPVGTPLWMIAVATMFAVLFGKEVFGGTGMNIWNPALLARAFLFFAYPTYISGNTVWVAAPAEGAKYVDSFTGATPLATGQLPDFWDMFYGFIPGSIGETSTFAILIGAAILLFTGIGSFRIMASVFAGGLFMGYLLNWFGPEANVYAQMAPHYQLVIGGFAFGAVFMATDPVTASQTKRGKIIYGFLIGLMAVLIRVLNPAYPEGMMLAILLMNTFAPLIDHYVVGGNIKRRLKRTKA